MQRNKGDMIIKSSTYVSFESSAIVEPRQRIFNIYIYLYVSDQSMFIGSEVAGMNHLNFMVLTLYFIVFSHRYRYSGLTVHCAL